MYHIVKITDHGDKILDSDKDYNKLVFWYNTLCYEHQQCTYCIKKDDKVFIDINTVAYKTNEKDYKLSSNK